MRSNSMRSNSVTSIYSHMNMPLRDPKLSISEDMHADPLSAQAEEIFLEAVGVEIPSLLRE